MNHRSVSTTLARAASVCRHVQSRLDSLRAITKDDASPVTIADFASQAVVARGLVDSGLIAGGLVAEETADFLRNPAHHAHLDACLSALRESGAWPEANAHLLLEAVHAGAADAACLTSDQGGWTLDPIDGTKGFLRGQQYCISLAFIRNGRVERGYLACPNLPLDPDVPLDALAPGSREPDLAATINAQGTLFWASADDGSPRVANTNAGDAKPQPDCARVQSLGDPISTIFPVSRPDEFTTDPGEFPPGTVIRLAESVESGHSNHSASAVVIDHAAAALGVPVAPPVRLDSQCKYAVVARSQADVYLRLPSKKGYVERIWDHAAGMIVAQRAGCIVTDTLGRPLDFSHGRGLEANRGIVAAPGWLHTQLIRSIARLAPRESPARS